jgi:hypothetical protein
MALTSGSMKLTPFQPATGLQPAAYMQIYTLAVSPLAPIC